MNLSSQEVLEIRKKSGWNEIVPSTIDSRLELIKNIFSDPMGVMLLTLGLIYWLLGKKSDAVILFISFIPVTAVDIFLEMKAKKALEFLKATLKSTAKVIRDHKIIEIPIREIVPGDYIVFEEGINLPADGTIVECEQLQISEAALTGESIPINKNLEDVFYGGTQVLTGRGIGKVLKIGRETELGKIAKLIESSEDQESPLKKKVNFIIKRVSISAIFVAILLFIVTFIKNRDIANSFIDSLTFGMAVLPEEFPLIFTLYLSLGAYRLSKFGVLVKSLPSVETLGSVDIICTDKTGTLTEGKFQLEVLEKLDQKISDEELWQVGLLACEEKPVDAMEMAIFKKASLYLDTIKNWKLVNDYPFEAKGKHMTHTWTYSEGSNSIVAMKGSVEGVLEHCHLTHEDKNRINERIQFWSSQGKRLLGLARKNGATTGTREADESEMNFVGILVFSDPVRASAKKAILHCQQNEIEVKMLTGDHPLTAHAIAHDLNITHSHDYLFTGADLLKMPIEKRTEAYLKGTIFSRVLPEQKHEMVEVLKANGKIVAMTGDGINDAPALKIADIGISMGENATDVARNSAKMILMKNDFNGIVEAIFEGRKVFANLKRSFSYLVSFHFPIVFFALIPPLFNMGNLLMPIHIVLLELVVHPISAFSFENLKSETSKHNKNLMTKKTFFQSLLSGILLSVFSLIIFYKTLQIEDLIHARSNALTTILLGNIFFVFVEIWPLKSIRFIYTILALIAFTFAILFIPYLATTLYLAPITLKQFFISLIVSGMASVPTFYLKFKDNR